MPKIVALEDHTLTQAQIAAMTGRSKEWVKKLAQEGVLERDGRGAYKLRSVCAAIIAHYEAMTDRSARTQSAARATDARAAEIQQRIAMRDRALIPIDEALQAMEIVVGTVNSELTGLPARATRDMAIRRKIEDEVNGTKGRIAASLRKGSAAARSGRGLDGADAEDDA